MTRDKILQEIAADFKVIKHAMMSQVGQDKSMHYAHMAVMHIIAGEERCYSKAIAGHLGVTPSAVSQITDVLMDEGYIEKHVDPVDRRQAYFTATAKGEEKLAYARQQHVLGLQSICRDIGDEELRSFRDIVRKMKRNIQGENK
jgi:DNA-binding MarR family transcriptional regulator